jgi:hypothetical protein
MTRQEAEARIDALMDDIDRRAPFKCQEQRDEIAMSRPLIERMDSPPPKGALLSIHPRH